MTNPFPPFRIKMTEPIPRLTPARRREALEEAHWNPFLLPSHQVEIDLLTDSGTGSMSQGQWSAMMDADEAYAGSRSFAKLKESVEEVFGFPYVLPTHQGRAAEHILFQCLVEPGHIVPNNMHFDTTYAHVQHQKAQPLNLAVPAAADPAAEDDFKGNVDLDALEALLKGDDGDRVPFVMVTLTNNSAGGQPVSLANLRAVRAITRKYGRRLFFDAARFAENAWFIREREPGQADLPVSEIVKEMMSLADGCTVSAKKDGLVNIGGLLLLRDEELYREASTWGVLFEGFPTYGGLAGRDLAAMAVGLREVVDEGYLAYRTGQVQYLWSRLDEAGIPLVRPCGGHAVYIDAAALCPHIPREQWPAWALTCDLYLKGGVRGVEVGGVMAGRDPDTGENVFSDLELVRLAIPRRTYTSEHMDAVADTVIAAAEEVEHLKGLEIAWEAPALRHFTARFQPVEG